MDTSTDLSLLAAAGTANLPAVLANIAPPPLCRGDPVAPYEALLAHIIAEVKPHGIVEHVWVRDYVSRDFEVVRLRRDKADILTANAGEGLRAVLRDLGVEDYFTLAKRWHARDPDAIAAVDAALAAAGLGLGVVRAQALAAHIREVEAIDRMICVAEARRDEMLRQLYGHQAALAERLRNAVAAHEQEVQDAEFTPVPVQTRQYVEAGG
jgi:hypothetical protein